MPGQAHRHPGAESWLGKSEQRDKWNFCLTAAKIAANQEQNHVKTTAPEPQPDFQGEGGFSRREGDKTLAELAQQFDIHPNQSRNGRRNCFESGRSDGRAMAHSGPVATRIAANGVQPSWGS